jgi:hypothetical protein
MNLQNITLDNRESPHRKRTQPLDLHWHGEKPEMPVRERGEVRHVLDDGNFVFQKNAVNRSPQVPDIIDVVRVDSDQGHARVCQKARRILGQERMPLKILRRVPVPGSACFDQHGFAREILPTRETRDVDCLLVLGGYFDGGEVRQFLQVEF